MLVSNVLNALCVSVGLVALTLLSRRRFLQSTQWRATVTPLASIIGSGFLIVAPLLHAVLGKWALLGMILLSVLAYSVGAVIRFNIRYAEEYLLLHDGSPIVRLEKMSQGVLGIAYAISVAFYTGLFTAFLFDQLAIQDPELRRWATSTLLLLVIMVAWLRGSRGLETIELLAVTLKLSIIAGVLFALASYDVMTGTHWFRHEAVRPLSSWDTVAMLAGMLMVTQGFETSRFMGDSYTPDQRIRAVRHSQWIATGIYVVFIGITCPLFLEFPILELNETTISQTLGQVATAFPLMLMVAAVASQLSAALADTIGGGGLVKELLRLRLPDNAFYVVVAGIAVILTWTANVFEIINYASKGFAAYYFLQTLIALSLLRKRELTAANKTALGGCILLGGILLFVVLASIEAPHGKAW